MTKWAKWVSSSLLFYFFTFFLLCFFFWWLKWVFVVVVDIRSQRIFVATRDWENGLFSLPLFVLVIYYFLYQRLTRKKIVDHKSGDAEFGNDILRSNEEKWDESQEHQLLLYFLQSFVNSFLVLLLSFFFFFFFFIFLLFYYYLNM